MKPAFIITARNKEKHSYRCVQHALAQNYPCEIICSDQHSDDNTVAEMERAIAEAPRGAEHDVRLVHCPVEGKYGMRGLNEHVDWLMDQTKSEWIFQCSADDYSLPGRVGAVMAALQSNKCVICSTAMWFCEDGESPGGPGIPHTGYPIKSGYVNASDGIAKLAYGSGIASWNREWFKRMGSAGDVTPDVFYGYLASLKEGFYFIAEPHHVHTVSYDVGNMGFQGKMRGAEKSGDKALMAQLNELNRFQLLDLYYSAAVRASDKYPLAMERDKGTIIQMILSQALGWIEERKNLHKLGITPGVL